MITDNIAKWIAKLPDLVPVIVIHIVIMILFVGIHKVALSFILAWRESRNVIIPCFLDVFCWQLLYLDQLILVQFTVYLVLFCVMFISLQLTMVTEGKKYIVGYIVACSGLCSVIEYYYKYGVVTIPLVFVAFLACFGLLALSFHSKLDEERAIQELANQQPAAEAEEAVNVEQGDLAPDQFTDDEDSDEVDDGFEDYVNHRNEY